MSLTIYIALSFLRQCLGFFFPLCLSTVAVVFARIHENMILFVDAADTLAYYVYHAICLSLS
jgi:hypothetical protein